jgi:hypothetical protein
LYFIINQLNIVDKSEVVNFLIDKRQIYKGKSGNRKLIRDDPSVYKSLNFYCESFKKYNNNKELPFLCKIDLANNSFKLDDDMLCVCKSSLKFNRMTQQWDKFYCKRCKKSPTSVDHFKLKYGGDWEIKWKELRLNMPVPKGKNEIRLLNQLEKIYNTTIIRDFTVLNFFPDGYSKELNTIYEVNESHHRTPSRKNKDNQRRGMIQHELKCNFVVIWDDTFDIEIYNYVPKK